MGVWSTLSHALHQVGAAGADMFDRVREAAGGGRQSREAAISMAVVALAAKMAAADGVVTMSEAATFWRRFDVPEDGRAAIQRLFELAQRDVAGFEAYAQKVHRLFRDDPAVREDILDILYTIAAADGVVHESEQGFLDRVAAIFALDAVRIGRVKARHLAPDGDPYAILGLSPGADSITIRTRYRELVREHHPDRLMARGMPAEFVRIATDRLATINAAYEQIEKAGT